MIASLVTTFNRARFLERSLPHVVAAGSKVLVVDDGSSPEAAAENRRICASVRPEAPGDVHLLYLPTNRGLAGAMNVGLSYLLADADVEFVSYFQDDVEVDPEIHAALLHVHRQFNRPSAPWNHLLFTGHHAKEHEVVQQRKIDGIHCLRKRSCRATHLFAHRDGWAQVMPIRSRGLGFPKRVPGRERGEGSNVDWWVTRDAPHPLMTWCVPGLVRTFAWQAADSCWDNRQHAGEDAQLSRRAIELWLRNRP